MKTRLRNLLITLLGALLLVLTSIGVAAAAEPRGSDADTASAARTDEGSRRNGPWFAPRAALRAIVDEDRLLQAAAEALDMPAEAVRTARREGRSLRALLAEQGVDRAEFMNAMRTAQRQILAEALQAGDITQAQADRLAAWMDRELREDLGGRRFGRHRRMDDLNPERLLLTADIFDASVLAQSVADALGMTTTELEAAKARGPEAFEQLDIDAAALMAAVQDAQRQMIANALQAGSITQAQADRLTAWMDRTGPKGFKPHGYYRNIDGEDFDPVWNRLEAAVFDENLLIRTVAEAVGMTTTELKAAKARGPEVFEQLDIDAATLMAAVQDAQRQMIANALQAGSITQAQADRLTAWIERENGDELGYPGARYDREAYDLDPDLRHLEEAVLDENLLIQTVAEAVGMTPAALEALEAQGPDAFEDLDIDAATLMAAVQDAQRQMIANALQTGSITQAQADRFTAWIERESAAMRGSERHRTDGDFHPSRNRR